jgi:hypothetical protein
MRKAREAKEAGEVKGDADGEEGEGRRREARDGEPREVREGKWRR